MKVVQDYKLYHEIMRSTPVYVRYHNLPGVGEVVSCQIDGTYDVSCTHFYSNTLFAKKYSARIENDAAGTVTRLVGTRARAIFDRVKAYCK